MSKELIHMGMSLVKILPVILVDYLILMCSYIRYGNLSKYGIVRPDMGPLDFKAVASWSAVIDVGTVSKIRSGNIKVVKVLESIDGNQVTFKYGKTQHFNVEDGWLLNDDGFPVERFSNNWMGRNGLYCVGLARRGIASIFMDAEKIADDIHMICRINSIYAEPI